MFPHRVFRGDRSKDRGVGVHVEETRKAADPYDRLAESEPVGGLFHSTC